MKKYLLVAGLLLFACEGEDANKFVISQTPDLSGQWQLSGQGEQSGCNKKLDNVSYQIEIADEWQIVATQTGNTNEDGFEEYALSLSNAPGFVSGFTGLAQGEDVSFNFDDTGAVEPISYSFIGKIVASNRAKGTFSAQGPGACVTLRDSTSFNLTVL